MAVAWPHTACAHSSVPGLAGLYTGMLHPFTMASQLLMLIVLALFVQQRLPDSELVLYAFLIGSLVGLALAALDSSASLSDLPAVVMAVITALLVAAAWPRKTLVLLVTGAASGTISGLLAWPDAGESPGSMIMPALGSVVGALLFVIAATAVLEVLRVTIAARWLAIGVRIAASWTGAIALLLGALAFKTHV